MDAEPADQDLLLLSLNLSDSEPDEAANPANKTSGPAPTTEYQPTRAERTALSEEAFQALKRTYRPKIENGNIYKTTPLPTTTTTTPSEKEKGTSAPRPLTKPENQSLLHAAEELYFFRRYEQAATFLRQVLAESAEGSSRIDGETRRLLGFYLGRCEARLEERNGKGEGEGVSVNAGGGADVGGAGGAVGGLSVNVS